MPCQPEKLTKISGVTLVAGNRNQEEVVNVLLDGQGRVERLEPSRLDEGRYLVPPLVDLHLDVLRERRRPRATVELGIREVLVDLDAECAGSGIGTVCVAARFEDEPATGIRLEDAVEVCRAVDELAPVMSADWRIHARVEVTDDGVLEALSQALAATDRIALISVMEHSFEKSRFASAAEHRRFCAQDWGVAEDEVDGMMARKCRMGSSKELRREQVAELAASRGIPLASHDDASVAEVNRSLELGSTICEFPLTMQAARHATDSGMVTVLGAPNAVRGRSTSPGNLLALDAVRAGVCGALCSDYLPHSMLRAALALAAQRAAPLSRIVDMLSATPAAVIGSPLTPIRVGALLNAVLVEPMGSLPIVTGVWRGGRQIMARGEAALTRHGPLPASSGL